MKCWNRIFEKVFSHFPAKNRTSGKIYYFCPFNMKYNRTNPTNHLLLFLKILFACSLEKNATQFTHSLLNIHIFIKLDFFLEFACPIFSYLKRRDSLCYNQFSKKKLMAEFVDVKQLHGFMQAILTFGRCYKRLNLPIEFWTQPSFFKSHRLWTCIQYKSSYSFLLF